MVSIALMFWNHRLRWGMCLLLVTVVFFPVVQMMTTRDKSVDQYVLQIGQFNSIDQGIDVYCNDVYLGQSPLTIFEEEFREQVEPWEQPPRQEVLMSPERMDEFEYLQSAKLFYTPHDYFERERNEYPRDAWTTEALHRANLKFYTDEDDYREALIISRYWWHFDKDGYVSLAPIDPSGLRSRDRSAARYNGTATIQVEPKITYPSRELHLQRLIHALRQSHYEPTEAWVTHFRKSIKPLFREFYQMAQRDQRLTRALHSVVKGEFGINDEMSEADAERVLDDILERVQRAELALVPSPETVALDLLGPSVSKAVEKRSVELGTFPPGRWRRQIYDGGERVITYYRQGKQAPFLPLEYAIGQLKPPTLFNRLVYESGKSLYNPYVFRIVGNYRRDEAVRLVRHYLRDTDIHQDIELITQIYNPDLEEDFRRFVRRAAMPGSSEITNFILSRADRSLTEADANALSDWVAHQVPLDDNQKLTYLSQINAPRTYGYIQSLIGNDRFKFEGVIRSLAVRSNPGLDQFLIDAYLNAPGEDRHLTRAILICNTSKMHSFLDKLWNESAEQRSLLLTAMREIEQGDANLVPWTEPISEITESSLRLLAIPVLSQIDTPEAGAILESWATDTDQQVKAAAQTVLGGYRERGRQAADLISGEIHPNDLLGPQTAYVWNGRDYVPESAAVEK